MRYSPPALRPHENIDTESETKNTLSENSESEYEETEFEESDLTDEVLWFSAINSFVLGYPWMDIGYLL